MSVSSPHIRKALLKFQQKQKIQKLDLSSYMKEIEKRIVEIQGIKN